MTGFLYHGTSSYGRLQGSRFTVKCPSYHSHYGADVYKLGYVCMSVCIRIYTNHADYLVKELHSVGCMIVLLRIAV